MLATIGYERAELADFIATLKLAQVSILVDVRERAQSRRRGFSKKALAAALEVVGIEYLHLPQLGDPKAGREAARAGNRDLFLDIYGQVLKTAAAQQALGSVEALVSQKTTCLMCFERDQNECHRKIVADEIQKRTDMKVSHLGVQAGAGSDRSKRRMLHSDQGAAAQV